MNTHAKRLSRRTLLKGMGVSLALPWLGAMGPVGAWEENAGDKKIAPNRTAAGQRRYPKSDIRRLSFVIIAQKLGFTIAQIRAQLSKLPDARTPTEADWDRIARGFRADLDQKIDTLTRLRDDLGGCIGCGCLSMKRCALFNPAALWVRRRVI